MPSASDHEQQAASNEAFYASLGAENADRADWAITTLFYAALHHVQAVTIRQGWKIKSDGTMKFPADHGERLRVVDRHLAPIAAEYRSLKNFSEGARYECQTITKATLQLAKASLDTIKAHIATLK